MGVSSLYHLFLEAWLLLLLLLAGNQHRSSAAVCLSVCCPCRLNLAMNKCITRSLAGLISGCCCCLQASNTGALLPSVCAVSLLPRSGREYLPQALQHLMDEGSPVADVFRNCDTCDHLAAENVKVTAVRPTACFLWLVSAANTKVQLCPVEWELLRGFIFLC